MFTVILVGRRGQPHVEQWRDLFVPFEERRQLAICSWSEGKFARTLDEAVPDLAQVIKGKREWRAIILGTGESSTSSRVDDTIDNPFDFNGMRRLSRGISPDPPSGESLFIASPDSLVRLTQMLLGVPELGPKGFLPDPSYEDPQTKQRVTLSDFREARPQLTDDEAQAQFYAYMVSGHHRQTHFKVVRPSADEEQAHEALSRLYAPRQVPPTEVLMVATRTDTGRSARGSLESAWHSGEDHVASRFVERNNYPASCRFLTFDMKPPGHAGFDLDELSYCLSILTLAINDLPASGLQADRLYRLALETDPTKLAQMLNEHLGELIRVREYIEARLRAQPPRTGAAAREILPTTKVIIDFDRLNSDRLAVPVSGYGLLARRGDAQRWRASESELSAEASRFMREPARALEYAVAEAREKQKVESPDDVLLTGLEVRELEQELAERSHALVRRAAGVQATHQELTDLIKDNDQRISRELQERPSEESAPTITAVALGAWLLAIVPYLIAALFAGGMDFAESLLVSVIVVGLVAAAALVTLIVMKRQFIALLSQFNRELKAFVARVTGIGHEHSALQEYATFLSDLLTYATGRKRLSAYKARLRTQDQDKLRLRRLQQQIEERIGAEKSLVRSLDASVHIEQHGHVIADVEQFGVAHARKVLLWQEGQSSCAFNKSGDSVRAPYPFIERITVEDLNLVEPGFPGHGAGGARTLMETEGND